MSGPVERELELQEWSWSQDELADIETQLADESQEERMIAYNDHFLDQVQ